MPQYHYKIPCVVGLLLLDRLQRCQKYPCKKIVYFKMIDATNLVICEFIYKINIVNETFVLFVSDVGKALVFVAYWFVIITWKNTWC